MKSIDRTAGEQLIQDNFFGMIQYGDVYEKLSNVVYGKKLNLKIKRNLFKKATLTQPQVYLFTLGVNNG